MIRRKRMTVEEKIPAVSVKPLSIRQFVHRIETEPGFSFARISDGGFFCILGKKGINCDGSPYSRKQADALIAMMRDNGITHGITSIALHATRATQWLQENNLDVDWYDADVMNKASDQGELWPFIECLKKRRSLIVGASHLSKLKGFPIGYHIECHPTHAFEEVDELEAEICFRVQKYAPDTILLSAGQGASPTLVSRLHAYYPRLTIIDTGSLFDPYVGTLSRSGHKRLGFEGFVRLGFKNFQEDIRRW